MWQGILVSIIASVVIGVVNRFASILKTKVEIEKEKAERQKQSQTEAAGWMALEVGVAKAQQEIADSAKKMAADGKITKGELKVELRNAEALAKRTAIELATGPAGKWLVDMAANAIGGMIDLILAGNKRDAE